MNNENNRPEDFEEVMIGGKRVRRLRAKGKIVDLGPHPYPVPSGK